MPRSMRGTQNDPVLLIEAGPEDQSYWSRIPLGFAEILFNKKYM